MGAPLAKGRLNSEQENVEENWSEFSQWDIGKKMVLATWCLKNHHYRWMIWQTWADSSRSTHPRTSWTASCIFPAPTITWMGKFPIDEGKAVTPITQTTTTLQIVVVTFQVWKTVEFIGIGTHQSQVAQRVGSWLWHSSFLLFIHSFICTIQQSTGAVFCSKSYQIQFFNHSSSNLNKWVVVGWIDA